MAADLSLPDLGRRLSAARLQRGVSQGTAARLAGVAPSYLSRIENGKIQPTLRTVLRIVRALRADLDEIVEPASLPENRRGRCPVSANGHCLLDVIRVDSDAARDGESYTPRQIKLLRRLAAWIQASRPDRLRAMEVLLEDLMRGASRVASA